jgi:cytochrome c peroxidase
VRQDEISRVYANIGKAIAAYERKIVFTPARFDRFVEAELAGRQHTVTDAFSDDERAGLRLFIGKANCSTCHNGSLLTDNHFHNTGVPQSTDGAANDSGRTTGVRAVMASEFNCVGKHSDAKRDDCSELRFAVSEGSELVRAFKTPSLRNAVTRPPFMHAGQFASISDVLAHYNRAPTAPAGKTELKRLRLSDSELRQLEAFLNTLVSPIATARGVPQHVGEPSGFSWSYSLARRNSCALIATMTVLPDMRIPLSAILGTQSRKTAAPFKRLLCAQHILCPRAIPRILNSSTHALSHHFAFSA